MFGEGINAVELFQLFASIREKDLVLEIKILDQPWEELSMMVIRTAIKVIKDNKLQNGGDIRLRLHGKETTRG